MRQVYGVVIQAVRVDEVPDERSIDRGDGGAAGEPEGEIPIGQDGEVGVELADIARQLGRYEHSRSPARYTAHPREQVQRVLGSRRLPPVPRTRSGVYVHRSHA